MKNTYALNYRNHNGKMTNYPYEGLLFSSVKAAKSAANNVKSTTKKNMRVVRVKLEKV